MSNFKIWDQKSHAKEWLISKNWINPKHLSKCLSIDETSRSNDELYTILTNKVAKGKKGSKVAMIAGTKVDTVIYIIKKIL